MGAVDTPERRSSGKKKGVSLRRTKRRVGVRIDMTPMVDVAFLLLIFFMVTTVFRTPKALEINLPPKKDTSVQVAESKTLTLRFLGDGRLYWKKPPGSFTRSQVTNLPDVLAPYHDQSELIVIVQIDRDAPFDNMVFALDELHRAHLTRFSVTPLTDKDKQEVEKL